MVRKLPEQNPRMESGPVQFGEDFPGIWIRGDSALAIGNLLDFYLINTNGNHIAKAQLTEFAKFLHACDIKYLGGEDEKR